MKLFCLFISLAIVNVLAVKEVDYKKEVYISNLYLVSMESSQDHLDRTVEILICLSTSITSLAMMLSAPENTTNNLSAYLQLLMNNEKEIHDTVKWIHETQNPITERINYMNIKDLSEMGTTRRRITYPSLKRLLSKVENGLPTELSLFKICFLIALLKTGSDPRYRIKNVTVDEVQGDCHLIDLFGNSVYAKFDDGFYRIDIPSRDIIAKLTNEIS